MCLGIAGITMALDCDDAEMKVGILGAARRFLVDEVEPVARVRAAWGDLSEEVVGEKVFESGGLWQLYRRNGSYVFRFASPVLGPLPYKVASFNQDFTTGEVNLHRPYFAPDEVVDPLQYPLDELLMLNLLARGRGAELHSCGIVDSSGEGYLFIGQSGAGKTTTARLWERAVPPVRILSDDRIILRKLDGQFWMYGTPWHGEADISCPSGAPLARIFFLRHGPKNDLRLLGEAEAVARLFSCSFPTFYHADGLDFTLSFYEEVAAALPCYDLNFVPDQGVVEFIRQQK